MRGVALASVLLALAAAVAAVPAATAGTQQHPEISDPTGDVTRGGASVDDTLAQSLDLEAVWVSHDAHGAVWANIEVADLTHVADLAATPSFSDQYAFVFTASSGETYQVSVLVGGADYGGPRHWDCQVETRSTQAWAPTLGYVDVAGGVIHERLTDTAAAAILAGPATSLSAQAWGSLADKDPQTDDWASGVLPYTETLDPSQDAPDGAGLVPCGLAPDPPVPTASGAVGMGSDEQVSDPPGDVVRGDQDKEPVHDAMADALDLLGLSFTRDPDGHYWAHMRLANLTPVAQLAQQPDLSLQYAAVLSLSSSQRDFQVSAITGGSRYANPAGSWRCTVEDLADGSWTETYGYVDVAHGIVHVRLTDAMAARFDTGAPAHDLGAQSWGSNASSSRPQTDDWAQSKATFKGPSLTVTRAPSGDLQPCGNAPPAPEAPAPASPAPRDAARAADAGVSGAPGAPAAQAPGPGPLGAVLLSAGLLWMRRRLGHT